MEIEDYRTWRTVPPDRSTLLLDEDTGKPTSKTRGSDDGPLARVAAVIHSINSKLSVEDCEQIVIWMKTIKRDRKYGPDLAVRDWTTFEKVLQALRDAPKQDALLRQALRLNLTASALNLVALSLCTAALVIALATPLRWYWSVSAFGVAVIVFYRGQVRRLAAAQTWKEQDRRYLSQSIGAARTVQELSHAGLFAYLPGTEFVPNRDENEALTVLRRERERLTDALYYDPDFWLLE